MAWREPLVPGESVAVNGTCLTVARCDSTRFTADVLSETERRTGLAELKPEGAVRAELRQVLYQTLMLEAVEDARFAPKALQAMREAYVEMLSQSLKDMILRFRAKFSL